MARRGLRIDKFLILSTVVSDNLSVKSQPGLSVERLARRPAEIVDARPNGSGYTGVCIHCGRPATKAAHFQEDGIVVIERYCDRCAEPSEFAELQKWYSGL